MTDRRPNRSRGSQHDDWLRDAPSAVAPALPPPGRYGVTISSMFRPVVTEQYPFEPPQVMPRYHGRHQLNRYDDGLEKCIGCELCAWACPADPLYADYQINYLRCIFCGMCIEACPTRALTMSTDFDELVGPGREGLIYEKEDLLAPVPDGAVGAPHPMVEDTEDGDYYRGRVTGSTQAQIDWVRAHRPDDPSLSGARAKAAPTASGWSSRQTVKGAVR